MKKYIVLALTVLMVLGLVGGATLANDPELPNWCIVGEWQGQELVDNDFPIKITVDNQDADGTFDGTIETDVGHETHYGNIEGQVTGDDIEFVRNDYSPDHRIGRGEFKYEGVILEDGLFMTGPAWNPEGGEFGWEASGKAIPIDYTVDYPAAPAVANELLKGASTSPRYGQGRDGGNFIANVAQFMEPGTMFNGISKYDVDAYRCAVAAFLSDPDNHDGFDSGVEPCPPSIEDLECLVLWLDADYYSEDDRVWTDKSGEENHATAPDGYEPDYIESESDLNDQPVVRFDGSNYLELDDFLVAGNDEVTAFIVSRSSNTTPWMAHFTETGYGTGPKGFGVMTRNGEYHLYIPTKEVEELRYTTSVTQNVFGLVTARYDGALAELFVDSDEKISEELTGTLVSDGTEGFTIGAYAGPRNLGYLEGDIAEILIFKCALSDEDLEMVEKYLNNKYEIF